MDAVENNVNMFADSIIDVRHQLEATSYNEEDKLGSHCKDSNQGIDQDDSTEKHSAVWTSNATSTLLKLYESKLVMLETPKKKKRIWLAISDKLKDYDIDMSPDQVRWKINALTKKYKCCIDTGVHYKFKFFKEMDHIYSKYNIDGYGYTISEILDRQKNLSNSNLSWKSESKAIIELRKVRLANRMESDRTQTKILIEKQWLEFLRRQEDAHLQRDKFIDKSLNLKEQQLELRRRGLELRQSIDLKKIQLEDKYLCELVEVEQKKCEILRGILMYLKVFLFSKSLMAKNIF